MSSFRTWTRAKESFWIIKVKVPIRDIRLEMTQASEFFMFAASPFLFIIASVLVTTSCTRLRTMAYFSKLEMKSKRDLLFWLNKSCFW